MKKLTPAAQAVLDAWSDNTLYTRDTEPQALAAALRAVAGYMFPNDTAQQCYDRILAIAAELEAL